MEYLLKDAPLGRVLRVKKNLSDNPVEMLEVESRSGTAEYQVFAGVGVSGDTAMGLNGFAKHFILQDIEAEEEKRIRRKVFPQILSRPLALGGSDPEVFVEDAGGKVVVPAWEFLPPQKEKMGLGASSIYWDGFQAEMNVVPYGCLQVQVDRIQQGLVGIATQAKKKFPTSRLSFKSVVDVPREMLMGAAPEHVVLGCKPSLNAWGLEGMPVMDSRELGWRFAGGHVHQEVKGLTPKRAEQVVRGVDKIVGIPSLLMFQKMDLPVRRQFYGLPGEHRLPAHGLEYRFLSNAWLCHPAIAHFTLGLVRMGIRAGLKELDDMWVGEPDRVVRTLVEGDLDEARRIVGENRGVYERVFQAGADMAWRDSFIYRDGSGQIAKVVAASVKALEVPVGEWVPLESMEKNWRIGQPWGTHCKSSGCMWQTLVTGKTPGE